jgi:hypothetical protein
MPSRSETALPPHKMPISADELTPELLNAIIRPWHQDVTVTQATVLNRSAFGDGMVSTAARATVALAYAAASPAGLPERIVFKLTRDTDTFIGPVYANEVRFYNLLRPELEDIETPVSLGGAYDPKTEQFGLILGDLTLNGAEFPNVLGENSIAQVEAVLDTLARLHARYWESERFGADLAWVETHLRGPLSEFMYGPVTQLVAYEAVNEKFKRELLERIGAGPEGLLAMQRRLHQHQATLPQTLLHGDAHIGNTFRYPDGRAGLLDWQLFVRGYCMHDVAYTITSALSTGTRRAKERELVGYYLDRLQSYGVTQAPTLEQSMTEFGRTLVWCLYIGWLTVPLINYGWEITLLNHLRIVAAYEDHQTAKLMTEI